MKKRVLILCTGNSCRSQMAEVLWRQIAGDNWEAYSAGSKPAGYVHPLSLVAMQNAGLNTDGLASKSVDTFAAQSFDLVVTVCDNAHEACPFFPGATRQLHWPFDDPAEASGTESEQLVMFERVRDQIRHRIEEYLNGDEAT